MRSKQLLSIVFSVIMFTGVSAGSVAFAESDEYDDSNDDDYYDRDYVKDGRHYDLDDRLEYFCEMTDEEKRQFFEDHPRLEQFSDRLANYCDLSDYSRDSKIKDFIRIHVTDEDRDRDFVKDHVTDEDWDRNTDADFRDKLTQWCEMSDEDKEATAAKYDKTEDQIAKADRYCTLNESDRADFITEHIDEFKAHMKDRMHDKDIRGMIDRYCEMSDEDKLAFVAEHDKAADHVEKMNEYCELDDDAREDYIKDHMKDKMRDNMTDKKPHMNYDRLCSMAESDRALEITDVEKLDRISEWCKMTPEEREDFKRDHKDSMKDKKMDKKHDFDGMSDMAKGKMSIVAKDILDDKMKFSDQSPRLKAMIMTKHDISDERMDEIKMKFKEKHGDLTDAKKSELKMKFKKHMSNVKNNMSDERRSAIHDRIADMKAFKADLRDRASDLTDEEKQELRADFIEKAKDMQLAWISPRTQMTAGLDAADVECREGFSLVMKASNGVAMCLKADTALKMIERGTVIVPDI
ncbi:MAG: ABC transporter substrate-binding protein [Nitrosopumilus sp.]